MNKNMIRKLEIVAMVLVLTVTMAAAQSVSQSSDGVQSSEASIGHGKVTSWDNIPKGNIGISHRNEKPIGYEIDREKLQELKKKPFVPGKTSTKDEKDTSISTLQQSLVPSFISGFDALDNLDNAPSGFIYKPPDPNIAAGPDHVGAVVNDVIAFYKKDGTLVEKALIENWFSNIFVNCGTCIVSDPRIVYDQNEGHWIVVVLGIDFGSKNSWYLLSVSKTSDPTGSWWNYKLSGSLTLNSGRRKIQTMADYPDLGFDSKLSTNSGAIYITSNQFGWAYPYPFYTSVINIVPKAGLYTGGGPGSYWRVYNTKNSDNTQAFTLRAAQTFSNSDGEFLINSQSYGGNYATLWKVVPTYPPNSPNVARQATISIRSYSPPPSAKQLGCTTTLDTIDNRMYNAVHRNGNLYTAFTEAYNWGSGTVAAIRYLNISTTLNTAQFDERYGADKYYYWFPTITTDSSNNILFVFARSSPTEYAGIYYTGRKTTDTVAQPSSRLKEGQECITDSSGDSRWGDYFGIGNDPIDGSKIWIYGEWAKDLPGISSDWDWGTYIGQITS